MPPRRAAAVARRVEAWFASNRRALPWRLEPRDPWASLVSEIMLQQTQAARVAERLPTFLARFPTPAALAAADEHEVLAAWSGLGYYRRARGLHACAKSLVERHAGATPPDVDSLRALPGVGAYTAGAVASIVFGARTPIVDANVARVLLRLEGADALLGSAAATAWCWANAERLVRAAASPGALNEGLMELGALVCTPSRTAGPRCGECPLASLCRARAEGRQRELPARAARPPRSEVHHAALIARDGAGRVLAQRRPPAGLWAGLWQAPTVESARRPTASEVARLVRLLARDVSHSGGFLHATTHRLVRFDLWQASAPVQIEDGAPMRWISSSDLPGLALATPHRRILSEALRSREASPARAGSVQRRGLRAGR